MSIAIVAIKFVFSTPFVLEYYFSMNEKIWMKKQKMVEFVNKNDKNLIDHKYSIQLINVLFTF